jgi:hypothetical protein
MSEPSHDLEAEFEALLAKTAAGNARDEERRETLAFATSDQEALEEYVAHMLLVSDLKHELAEAAPPVFASPQASILRTMKFWLPALAAAVALAFLLLSQPSGMPDAQAGIDSDAPIEQTAFATVHVISGKPTGEWNLPQGSPVPRELIQLPPSAIVDLQFASGATSRIQGPALFRVVTNNSLELRYGHTSATVPPQAVGFSVDTPLRRIVDLGTRFGVWIAQDGTSKIFCSDGKIAIQAHGMEARHELAAGQGVIYTDAFEHAIEDDTRLPPIGLPPDVEGDVRFIPYVPKDLRRDNLEAAELVCFAEQVNFRLPANVAVEHQRPGQYTAPANEAAFVPAGTVVDCYFVHFDPPKATETGVSGALAKLTFKQKVVGVISDTATLQQTDKLFGPVDGHYHDHVRGADYGHSDFITIGEDGHSVGIDFKGQRGTDQIRILVESSP